jgi:hypothetical protein
MKKLFLSTIFLFTSAISITAQVGSSNNNSFYSKARVYISIDQPVRGQAKEDKKIFIDPYKGSFAYVIIDNYPDKFQSKRIKLISYKKNNGKYEKINSTDYDIDDSFTYTFIKYSFNSTGDYAFDAYDGNGTFIKSAFVLVENDANDNSTVSLNSNFSDARAFISVDVPVNGVAKESKTINIDKSEGSYAYIVLDNYPDKLNTSQVILKSYRKINGKYEKINQQNYDIDGGNFFTYIKYSFFTAGEYAFDIYDKNGGFIKTAYVTVQYK